MTNYADYLKKAKTKLTDDVKKSSPSKEMLDAIRKTTALDNAFKGLDVSLKKPSMGGINKASQEVGKAYNTTINEMEKVSNKEKNKYKKYIDDFSGALATAMTLYGADTEKVMREMKMPLAEILGDRFKQFNPWLIKEKAIHDFAVDGEVPLVGYLLLSGQKKPEGKLKSAQETFKNNLGMYRELLEAVAKEGKKEYVNSEGAKFASVRCEAAHAHLKQALDAVVAWKDWQEKQFKALDSGDDDPTTLWPAYEKKHAAPNLAVLSQKLLTKEIARLDTLARESAKGWR